MTDDTPPAQQGTGEQVNPSAVPPATKSVLLDVMIVATFFPIVSKLIGKGDVVGIINALQTSEGAAFLAVVVPIAATAWRARLRVLRWAKAMTWAREAPNSLVVVKEPSPPPAAG
jgi:hypothetical protein